MAYTVLVVDDEKIILDGLIHTYDWAGQGFKVVGSATGGLAAYELIDKIKPDLVMTDIRMQDIDGIELIRRCRKLKLNTIFVVISAYRDFDYAREACEVGAFTYVLKPFNNEEFSHVLNSVRSVIDKNRRQIYREQIFAKHKREIIGEKIANFIEWSQESEIFAKELKLLDADIGDETQFCAISVDVSEPVGEGFFPGGRELSILFLCERLMQDFEVYRVKLESGTDILVLYNKSGVSLHLQETLREIAEELEDEGKTLYACYGQPQKGLSGLRDSCRQALEGMEYTYENSLQTILGYSNRQKNNGGICLYPELSQQKIQRAILQNDQALLSLGIKEFAETLERSGCGRSFWLNCYYRLSYAAQFFLISVYGEEAEIENYFNSYNKRLSHIGAEQASTELLLAIKLVLKHINTTVVGEVMQKKDQYMEAALELIDENLGDSELSVIKVAQELHLNPIYFGRIFKQLAGKSFREFLMVRRLTKAKLLLESGSGSIIDICFAVGMSSHSYFSTAFKKQYGLLPSEFKTVK